MSALQSAQRRLRLRHVQFSATESFALTDHHYAEVGYTYRKLPDRCAVLAEQHRYLWSIELRSSTRDRTVAAGTASTHSEAQAACRAELRRLEARAARTG